MTISKFKLTNQRGGGGAAPAAFILTGLDANIPAAGVEGTLYLPTDGVVIYRDTGAAWERWGHLVKYTEPDDPATWNWINNANVTVTKNKGTWFIVNTGNDARNEIIYKAAPAPPYTITVCMMIHLGSHVSNEIGPCFLESATGKFHVLSLSRFGNVNLQSRKWTDFQTFSADYAVTNGTDKWVSFMSAFYFRIQDNGVNRICSWSYDGVNYMVGHTVARADFLTADKVGIAVRKGAGNLMATVLSWEQS